MTTNERFADAGLMELWDRAKATKDHVEMVRLLQRVGFTKFEAEVMVADLISRRSQRRTGNQEQS